MQALLCPLADPVAASQAQLILKTVEQASAPHEPVDVSEMIDAILQPQQQPDDEVLLALPRIFRGARWTTMDEAHRICDERNARTTFHDIDPVYYTITTSSNAARAASLVDQPSPPHPPPIGFQTTTLADQVDLTYIDGGASSFPVREAIMAQRVRSHPSFHTVLWH